MFRDINHKTHRRKITKQTFKIQVKQNETFRTILFIYYCVSMERLHVCRIFGERNFWKNSVAKSTTAPNISFMFIHIFCLISLISVRQTARSDCILHGLCIGNLAFHFIGQLLFDFLLNFAFSFIFFYFLLHRFFIHRHSLLICVFCFFLFRSPSAWDRLFYVPNFVACLAFLFHRRLC